MGRLLGGLVLCSVAAFAPATAGAQEILIEPYVQWAEGGFAIMWEAQDAVAGSVTLNPDGLDPIVVTATSDASMDGGVLFTAVFDGLDEGTTYTYVANTDGIDSAPRVTRTVQSDDPQTVLFAASDMQHDDANPQIWGEIVVDGMLQVAADLYELPLEEAVDALIIPGDLVAQGREISDWRDQFFEPAQPMLQTIPVYPVAGNHEDNTPLFDRYFNLPGNGTERFNEHWWAIDRSNVRIIGLDSNSGYLVQEQLDWLDGALAEVCDDDTIDFVFAQMHHPFLSELWPPGELDYSGEIIRRMEGFTDACDKPTIHFFGHTHGYSRGQSRDHQHLWVNVATGGGNIDFWGEYEHIDYDEFTVSQDEYGFVLIEVDNGPEPEMRLVRYGRGDPTAPQDNVIRDEVVFRANNVAPAQPVLSIDAAQVDPDTNTIDPDCFDLQSTAYADSDDDPQQGVHWQVAADCDHFDAPIAQQWIQAVNEFDEVNQNEGIDLALSQFDGLLPNTSYCARVRHRDDGLLWSDWSETVIFDTGPSQISPNLVVNGGAESDLEGWRVVLGLGGATTGDDCITSRAPSGDAWFSAGGVCGGPSIGQLSQSVDVAAYGDLFDAGTAEIIVSATVGAPGGHGNPRMDMQFRDESGGSLGVSEPFDVRTLSWRRVTLRETPPPGTRIVQLRLHGASLTGPGVDSFYDDVALRVDPLMQDLCEDGADFPDPVIEADSDDVGTDIGDDAGTDVDDDVTMDDVNTDDTTDDTSTDSATDADDVSQLEPETGEADGGCLCSSSGRSNTGPWFALGLLAVGIVRRRGIATRKA